MHPSLLTQFRGALLGAAIGSCLSTTPPPPPYAKRLPWQVTHTCTDSGTSDGVKQAIQMAVSGTESLICWGKFNLAEWQSPIVAPTLPASFSSRAEKAIAVFPLLLFFHEDLPKLQLQLRQVTERWTVTELTESSEPDDAKSPTVDQAITVLGATIAHSLKHTLHPSTFLQAQLSLPTLTDPLRSLLSQIQHRLETRTGFASWQEDLLKSSQGDDSQIAIGLALYCFLTTPDDFRLSLLRAIQTDYRLEVVCPLVGVLSGAYNGVMGIPAQWRFAVAASQAKIPVWQRSTAEILQLADRLLAVWSGMCDPIQSTIVPNQSPAVFAPGVIRPR